MALTHPASLLLFVGIGAVVALVRPPVNVTLHCLNFNNTLTWDYWGETAGLKYRVDIGAYSNSNADDFQNVSWVEPPAQEADLSFLSDPSEEYYLTVTAVLGDKESNPSPEDGVSFSYSKESLVNHKCFVDLPPVSLTAQPHNRVRLRFQHPWLPFYQKQLSRRTPKSRRKKSHDDDLSEQLPIFAYEVELLNQKQEHHSFFCEEEWCEEEVPVDPAQEEHCLQIRGDLEEMLVKDTQVFCAPTFQLVQGSSHSNKYVYMVVSLLVGAVVLISGMVCYKKTRASSKTRLSKGVIFSNCVPQGPNQPVADVISQIEVEPTSPTPLMSSMDTDASTECVPASHQDNELRLPLGVPPEGEDVLDVQGGGGGGDSAAYTSGTYLEDEPPAYEKRDAVVGFGDVGDNVADGLHD